MSALQLETAAAVLGPVLDEVVFVGGATIHLWITDPAAPPVRATEDVDVVCELATQVEYYRLGARLRERGLQEAVGEPVLCRWRSAEPRARPRRHADRPQDPLLVATKLCAWEGRGAGDLLGSLDIHDVLTLFDGRPELTEEIQASEPPVRRFIETEIAALRAESYFDYAVDGATAPYGSLAGRRADSVRARIDGLLA